ncbi:MAG: DUF4129 domain-containing protein, partial [Candidatus Competibacteraceae bacterium]
PAFLLLHLLCWGNWWLVPWLLWWLKPLLDRAPLYVLGRALFGAIPDRRQFWRDLPGLLRRQALAALTVRRFDPARSFNLPVAQLEGLSGKVRRQRLRDLGRPHRGPAEWLTLVGLHLEIALDLALIALVWMLIPDFVALEFLDLFDDSGPGGQLWLNLVGFIGLTLVEPFYVAAGFALYLNRRTWLEAWDLEIGFRRLAARLAKVGRTTPLILAGLVLGASLATVPVAGSATESTAAENPVPVIHPLCEARRARTAELVEADSPVKRELAELLREPELQICAVQDRWHFREDGWPKESAVRSRHPGRGWWFATVVEYLLWFATGVCLAMAGWWLWRRAPHRSPSVRRAALASSPPLVRGRDEIVAPPNAELGAAAWRLWTRGQTREALRLLYQGSLAGLTTHYATPVPASATEEECLRLATARLADSELRDFFQRLTRVWQAAAYGHRPPDDATVESLCAAWPRHFAASAGTPP